MFSGEQAIVLRVTCVVHDFRVAILFLDHANRPEYNQLPPDFCTMTDTSILTRLFVRRGNLPQKQLTSEMQIEQFVNAQNMSRRMST